VCTLSIGSVNRAPPTDQLYAAPHASSQLSHRTVVDLNFCWRKVTEALPYERRRRKQADTSALGYPTLTITSRVIYRERIPEPRSEQSRLGGRRTTGCDSIVSNSIPVVSRSQTSTIHHQLILHAIVLGQEHENSTCRKRDLACCFLPRGSICAIKQ
jgi:hypothetical protein